MKEFFVSLCAFVIMSGVLRAFVSEENFSRYYGLISGIVLLLLIVTGLPAFTFDMQETAEKSEYADDGVYERTVLARSEQRLSENAQKMISEKTGTSCKIGVSLDYSDDIIAVSGIEVDGVRHNAEILYLLCDYFSVKESAIHFNG